jgi:hypothetical protein
MGGMHRIRRAFAIAAVCGLVATAPAAAQTETQETSTIPLTPTQGCPQADIDQLQRVITFVRGKSWAEQPDKTAFAIAPDTAACRVVLKINKVSAGEQAALERGGEGRLSIERTKERAEPSRLPLLLWVVFGGAGLVFVFVRYGRR